MTSKPPIDMLALFGRFGREQRISIRDPRSLDLFADHAKESVVSALNNRALIDGKRTENMFEALIVSLGHYQLFKPEDVGLVHPVGKYTAPDFRVILKDGAHWLIEVKNVYDPDPSRQRFRARPADIERLTAYASAVGCPLKLALYWARWGLWTLIDPSDLIAANGKLTIDMFRAVLVNEFSRLGDRTIGTTPPLKLRLSADSSKDRTLSSDGEVRFTIGNAALFSGDHEITNPLEQEVAWIFIQYGDWECGEPQALLSNNNLDAIEFVCAPRERDNDGQNFEIIGTLSSMFSRFYAEQTITEGSVVQTEANLIPDWFSPLISNDYKSDGLPLWRFVQQPNRIPSAA